MTSGSSTSPWSAAARRHGGRRRRAPGRGVGCRDRRVRGAGGSDLAPLVHRALRRPAGVAARGGAAAAERALGLRRGTAVQYVRVGGERGERQRAAHAQPHGRGARRGPRPRDRAGDRRLRSPRRVPRLDASGRAHGRRRAGARQGPGRVAGPPRAARRRGSVPAAGRAAAAQAGRHRRGRRGGHAPARLAGRRAADGRASRPDRHVRLLPGEDADDEVRLGPRAHARGQRGEVSSATIARANPDWSPVQAARSASTSTPSVPRTASALDRARTDARLRARRRRRRPRRRHAHDGRRIYVAGEAQASAVQTSRCSRASWRARQRRARQRISPPCAPAAPRGGLRDDPRASSAPAPDWTRSRTPRPSSAAARTSRPARSTPPRPARRRR